MWTLSILNRRALLSIGGLLCLGSLPKAGAIVLSVAQDGYINAEAPQRGNVQGSGISANLIVRTPNGPGAFQYNNLAFLGFDTSSVDLSTVTGATLSFTVGANSSTTYNGDPIRLYLLDDLIGGDDFDETTLTFDSAIADYGVERGNALTEQRVPGDIVGELNATAPGSTMTFTLSGDALTSLQGSGLNNFATFVVESRSPNNAIFQIASKESDQAGASLTLVPEPSTAVLALLGLPALLLRRRR